jgi:AcrR family transcriptional regulator
MIGRKAAVPQSTAEHAIRHRIIAESRRHFFAQGVRRVTMDDLAKELGMSKKTLYACFPSKSALLKAVILEKFRDIDADLSRITSKASSDCGEALRRLLTCVQEHTGEIQPPFVRDIRREAPELFSLVESRRRRMIHRHFGKVFLEGRRAGLLRADIHPKLAIEILLGAVQAIMNPPTMEELRLTPKSGFSAIIKVVLEGLITEKARSV